MDLLQHVVRVLATLHGVGRQLALANRALGSLAMLVNHLHAGAVDRRDVALLQEHEPARHGQQRRDVRGDEVLALAQAHDDRAACACQHDGVRVLLGHDRKRIGAVQLAHGRLHGVEQALARVEVHVHPVRDHLGVGLGAELVATALQVVAQRLVVLDDAVVHDGDAVARDVRVGIALARHAVGRPAGVRDAELAVHRALVERVAQFLHLADGAQPAHLLATVQHGDAGGVVAAVLEALQPLDQDGDDVAVSDRTDDAAHGDLPWSPAPGPACAPARPGS